MAPLSAFDLDRLAFSNFVEGLREFVRWGRGGRIEEAGGTLRTVGETRFPAGSFNTAVCLEETPADPDAWLQEQRVFFEGHERGFSVHTRASQDRALAEACLRQGLLPGGEPPVMVRESPIAEPGDAPRIEVSAPSSQGDYADFVDIVTSSFADMDMPEAVTRKVMGPAEKVLSLPWCVALARHHGGHGAAAMLLFSHAIAGIYWVATRHAARRRGLAAACVRHLTNLALESGARAVVLQASDAGAPLYRKLGFREIDRYPWYYLRRGGERAAGAWAEAD